MTTKHKIFGIVLIFSLALGFIFTSPGRAIDFDRTDADESGEELVEELTPPLPEEPPLAEDLLMPEEPPEESSMPGQLEGTGTSFELEDSEYLNVIFQSTKEITVLLESVPKTISISIEPSSVDSTELTIGNLESDKTYYKYQDSYKNEAVFTTDGEGSYTFAQDLSQPHHVWIQEEPSTVFLPEQCSTYGTWDEGTSTCTLSQDLTESVEITEDNITLDCDGHKINGSGTGYGIYLHSKEGITVKNCTVSDFSKGIYLYHSLNNNLTSNTILNNNSRGIWLDESSDNALANNTISNNDGSGIWFEKSSNNTLTGNTVSDNDSYGIYFRNSSGNNLTSNYISNNDRYGICLYYSSSNNLTDNIVDSNDKGIVLRYSSDNNLSNNIVSSSSFYGIWLDESPDNILTDNTVSNNDDRGVYLIESPNNNLVNNTVSNNKDCGIEIWMSSGNTLTSNVMSENLYNFGISSYYYDPSLADFTQNIDTSNTVNGKPIYYWINEQDKQIPSDAGFIGLVNSKNITVKDLTLVNNKQGVLLAFTENSIIENITISDNYYGIYLLSSSNNNLANNNALNNVCGISPQHSSNNNLANNIVELNNISGVSLLNSSSNNLTDNIISNNSSGIGLKDSSNNNLANNIVDSNYHNGICLSYSSNSNLIIDNTVNSNNSNGIDLFYYPSGNTLIGNTVASNGWYGIRFYYSSNNDLTNNTVSSNEWGGIYLWKSSINNFNGNTVSGNRDGIYLKNSSNNNFTNNIISDNYLRGIWLYSSDNNKIYHNNFIDNYSQAIDYKGTNNLFNDSYPSGGNYWNDYTERYPDAQEIDGSGIWDTSYTFSGGQDNYPFMEESGWEVPEITCMPVPGRTIGSASERKDLIFVPDDDYEGDIDSFLEDVNHKIDARLGGIEAINENLDRFNFYYTEDEGHVNTNNCGEESSLPEDLIRKCPFADAVVVLHTGPFGDCANESAGVGIYSAEGPTRDLPSSAEEVCQTQECLDRSDRSFIHESGHGIFELTDEYRAPRQCYTKYFQPNPYPNIWSSLQNCIDDATQEEWDPNECYQFCTEAQCGCPEHEIPGNWWKLGNPSIEDPEERYLDPNYKYVMSDGQYFYNGFGKASERRINWVFDFLLLPIDMVYPLPFAEKAMSFKFNINDDQFTLLDSIVVNDSPPNYLPGEYSFTAKVLSPDGKLLGKYGLSDPRMKSGEIGYTGPTWLDSVDFTLVLPHFHNVGQVDIIDSATEELLISVDVLEYAIEGGPVANAGSPYEGNEGSPVTFDASGSHDLDGEIVLYEWDFDGDGKCDVSSTSPVASFTWDDDFTGTVFLRITDNDGLTDVNTAEVTVNNVSPTVEAGEDVTIQYSDLAQFSGSFTDPGVDTHTIEWDFGDETTVKDELNSTHQYLVLPGTYTATLTVTDDDGGVGTDTLEVTVTKEVVVTTVQDQQGFTFDTVVLEASVKDDEGELLIGGPFEVMFIVGDHQVGQAQIDENGQVKIDWIVDYISQDLTEIYPIQAFLVDNQYYQGEGQASFLLKSARWLKEGTLAKLENIKTGDKKIDREIDMIIDWIKESLDDELWLDASHLKILENEESETDFRIIEQGPNSRFIVGPGTWIQIYERGDLGDWSKYTKFGTTVFQKERLAVTRLHYRIKIFNQEISWLEKLIEIKKSRELNMEREEAKLQAIKTALPIFEEVIDNLIKADELLAKIILEEAKTTEIQNPKFQKIVDHFISLAEKELAKAYQELEENRPYRTIDRFKKVWRYSQMAMKFVQ